MSNLKKIAILTLVSVLGVIFFTQILSVSKDFLHVIKGIRERAPKPYYSNLAAKYSNERKTSISISSQADENAQDKRNYDHGPPTKEYDVVMNDRSGHTLPQEVIEGVKTFVFFIGYSRSGSGIMSSLMDAHPHAVVAYQYGLFKISKKSLTDKSYLFNKLYRKSQGDVENGWRSDSKSVLKNYTLHVQSLWQGKYDQYISLIGDKNAGDTVEVFVTSPSTFIQRYKLIQKTVRVPVKAVFVVRNPFDIISTRLLYLNSNMFSTFVNGTTPNLSNYNLRVAGYKTVMKKLYESGNIKEFQDARLKTDTLAETISIISTITKAVEDIIEFMGRDNVWQVHNVDLVNDPEKTLIEMCDFFQLQCSADYIKTCTGMVYKSVSKTRDLIVWPQKERQKVMDRLVRRFSFFNRYTFESD